MVKAFPKEPTRTALQQSLPRIFPETESTERIPFTYVPPSHARAIDPDSVLVEGIRGAGKSFWWNALNQDAHRSFVASAFPETRLGDRTRVGPGYGLGPQDDRFPTKDVIQKLAIDYDPRHIWKAVVASHLQFPDPFPLSDQWLKRVDWVAGHPEEYDQYFARADRQLVDQRSVYVILFDALDRLAADWVTLRPIAKALFQLALDVRSSRAVRLKLFVRPDMVEDREILAFPDASKLLGQKVSLAWRKVDLYALLFQCLGNDVTHGADIRKYMADEFSLAYDQKTAGSPWTLPRTLRSDEGRQREVFDAIAGPTMASGPSGHKRGFPYTWLPNHLADGRDQVSPRSYAAALRSAAVYDQPESWLYPIHYEGLKSGVQAASQIRVDEIVREDYPWVNDAIQPLKNLTVPCPASDFLERWEIEGTVEKLSAKDVDKLPPQHLAEGGAGLLKDLESLNLIQRLSDGRIQMPDVYRVAFGLGRKGGVKPVR